MERKKLPVGISDFRKMIEENYYYVDKSLFIKEIIDNGSETILLPRPRRFGKTLNLSVLRYFYEKTREDTSYLFRDLAIWRQGENCTGKQGQYPVIYLTFKDVKCGIWEECSEELRRVIGEEYRRHKYVLEGELLDPDEKAEYLDIIRLAASKSAYQNSLKKLSIYLAEHYGTKTVILIDEYDTPIHQGYLHGYYDQISEFMRNCLSGALKDNSCLEKGVLTGILRVAKESIFSGLNNLEVSSLLKQQYSAYFGLLEHEVEDMLRYYGIAMETEEIKNWYNGYVFGDSIVYNPWSIINFAKSPKDGLIPYWVNTSDNDLVKRLLTKGGQEVKEDLETLIRDGCIRKAVDDSIVFKDIENSTETIWSFLLFSGYLKVQSITLVEGVPYCELAIPNKEVKSLYRQIILGWFTQTIHKNRYEKMLKGLVTGDLRTFETIFKEFVMQTFSYFDTREDESESFYHAFVLGLLVSLHDTYEVKSNRESGLGRHDVMLIPKEISGRGIVMEFKKAGKETLEEAANKALDQIEENRYEQELISRGVNDILKLGIAFEGKEFGVKSS